MSWKSLLSSLVIIGIIALLFVTESGRRIASLFGIKAGEFITAVLPSPPKQEGKFQILLESEKDSFYGQSYELSNSTFVTSGICQRFIKINEITIEKESIRCNVTIENFKGKFDYTKAGSIAVSADSSRITIDGVIYISGKPIHVEIEVVPFEFLLTDLIQDKISLSSLKGEVKKFKEDGSVKSIEALDEESIEISNFAGHLKLSDGSLFLNGYASSVKGEKFSW